METFINDNISVLIVSWSGDTRVSLSLLLHSSAVFAEGVYVIVLIRQVSEKQRSGAHA